MNSSPQYQKSQRMKPLCTPQVVAIKSLYTCQDFARRRPKNATALKFSWQYRYSKFLLGFEKKAQLKLLEALKHLKCLRKADLTGFYVNEFRLNQAVSESIYKRMAKVQSLSVMRTAYFPNEKAPFTDKWMRSLAGLQNLNYGLSVDANFEPDPNFIIEKFNDPLGHLKYCPKIQSLSLDISGASHNFDQVFLKFGCFQTSLKHLSIKSSLDLHQLNLPLEKLQQLQSVNFYLPSDHWSLYMSALSNLPLLEDLDLTIYSLDSINPSLPPEFLETWRRITSKKQLKKLSLFLGPNLPTTPEIFDDLQDCCQLTHFSLHLHISKLNLLPAISQCLTNLPQLQSLRLQLFDSNSLNPSGFAEICSEISNLKALRHLQLSFFSQSDLPETEKELDFFSYFQKLFGKPTKIETLSLSLSQADPSEILRALISGLQYSSSALQKLKVDLSRPLEDSSLIELLLSSLENMRELQLRHLNIIDFKTLKNVVEIAEMSKSLTVLEIGKIGGTVTQSECDQGIERILKKRGLRKFLCTTDKSMTEKNIKENAKEILRKNPFLEEVRISNALQGCLDQEIYTWI